MGLENKTVVLTVRGTSEGIDKLIAEQSKLGLSFEKTSQNIEKQAFSVETAAARYSPAIKAQQELAKGDKLLRESHAASIQKGMDKVKADQLLAAGLEGLTAKYASFNKATIESSALAQKAAAAEAQLAAAKSSIHMQGKARDAEKWEAMLLGEASAAQKAAAAEAQLASARTYFSQQGKARDAEKWEAMLLGEAAAKSSIHMQGKARDAEKWEAMLLDEAIAADISAKGLSKHGAASYQATLRTMEFFHAGRSVTEMLLAGQNPIRAFTMEGVRLAGVMGATGGLVAGFIGIAAGAAAIIAPFALAISHAIELNSQFRALNSTAIAYGNRAFGAQQAQGMAYSMAASGTFSRSDTVSAVQELEKLRTLSSSTRQAIAEVAVPFAEATGQKPVDAVKQLGEALKGGYDGIMKLNEAYGFLNPAQTQNILNLSMQGKGAEAARIAMGALTKQEEEAAKAARSAGESASIEFVNAWKLALDNIVTSPSFQRFEKFFISAATSALNFSFLTNGPSTVAYGEMKSAEKDLDGVKKSGAPDDVIAGFQRQYDIKKAAYDVFDQKEQSDRSAANDVMAKAEIADAVKTEKQIADAKLSAMQDASRFTAGRVAVAGMYGVDQERAAIQQSYKEQMLSALEDPAKQAQAEASRSEATLSLNARLSASENQHIRDMQVEYIAQQRLADAAGDYNETVKAQIQNEIDKRRIATGGKVVNDEIVGGAMSKAQEASNRASLQQSADANERSLNKNFILDLQEKTKAKQDEIAAASAIGASRPRGILSVDATIENAVRTGKIKSDENGIADAQQVKDATDAINEYNKAIIGLQTTQYAKSISTQFNYNETVLQIKAVEAAMKEANAQSKEYAVTEDDIANSYEQAYLKKLQASKDWADGAEGALRQYAAASQNYGVQAANFVNTSFKSIEDGMMNFAKGTQKPIDAIKSTVLAGAESIERSLIQKSLGGVANSIAGLFGAGPTSGSDGSAGGQMQSAANVFSIAVDKFAAMTGLSAGSSSGGIPGLSGSGASGGGGLLGSLFGGLGNIGGNISDFFSIGGNMVPSAYGAADFVPAMTDYASALSAPASSGFMDGIGSLFAGFFAGGTDHAPPGFAIVGENGPELVQMGGGERIYPNAETSAIMSGYNDNSPMPSNGSNSSGGSTFHPGAIQVHAPGATREDAAAIAEQVAQRVSAEHWKQNAPELKKQSVNESLTKTADQAMRGGRFGRAMRGGNG